MSTENGPVQHINHGYESDQVQTNYSDAPEAHEDERTEMPQVNGDLNHDNQHHEEDRIPVSQTNGHVEPPDGGNEQDHLTEQTTVPENTDQTAVTEQPAITEADPSHVVVLTQTSTEPLCEQTGQNEAKAACVLGFLVFLLCGGLFGLVGMIIAFFADRAYKKGRYAAARSRRNVSVACSISGVAVFMVAIVIIIIVSTKKRENL